MARTDKGLIQWADILLRMAKDGVEVAFDTTYTDKLLLQGETQDNVKRIMKYFPGAFWMKSYNEGCRWWEYDTEWKNSKINIYAVHESPRTCKAIMGEKEVEETVATGYVTSKVIKKVVIGWDCGKHEQDHLVDQTEGQEVDNARSE